MNAKPGRWILAVILVGTAVRAGRAAGAAFEPHELFRLSFGKEASMLEARVENGNFLIPREFTLDNAGHFYIFDTNRHRIARYSFDGKYEMQFRYLATARQVFAHADAQQNLWLLISDPENGLYYGVYDPRGKLLHSGVFSRFNQFRLHLDDHFVLHVIVSSDQKAAAEESFILDEKSLLMKKENIARPPETHHEVNQAGQVFFVDQVPDASQEDAQHRNHITDAAHRSVADIQGTVLTITDRGEIYTRVGPREIRVYDVQGHLKGNIVLQGLSSSCSALRFDADGNLYQLDGVPDKTDAELRHQNPLPDPQADWENLHYTAAMPGMRMIQWTRR